MFKVGQDVVLNNSSQNKVMRIQAYNDEFIRAYWSKKNTRLRMSQTLDTPHPKKSQQDTEMGDDTHILVLELTNAEKQAARRSAT